MIHEVDDAIRSLLRDEALAGTDVDILFDAPTTDWAARRTGPTVNVYLYDIREHLARRTAGLKRVLGDEGHVVAIQQPPRWYRLSYLVTAWTQRPEDEHRLLSAVLASLIVEDRVPVRHLSGSLAELKVAIEMTIALPTPDERSISEMWTALGGDLKPSLDLVVTAPLIPGHTVLTPDLVRETPRVGLRGEGGELEVAGGARAGGGRDDGEPARRGGKRKPAAAEDEPAAAGAPAPAPAPAPPAGAAGPSAVPLASDTRQAGSTDAGRIIRVTEIR